VVSSDLKGGGKEFEIKWGKVSDAS